MSVNVDEDDRTVRSAAGANLPDAAARSRFRRPDLWEQWCEVGLALSRCADSLNWWLGDWLAFGEHRYGTGHGEAVAATGFEYKTLRNYVVVTRRFEMSRWRDILSFGHHAELGPFGDVEQDRWLGVAKVQKWSRAELRRQLRNDRQRMPGARLPTLRLSLDTERVGLWRRAASTSGRDLQGWMIAALDAAVTAAALG